MTELAKGLKVVDVRVAASRPGDDVVDIPLASERLSAASTKAAESSLQDLSISFVTNESNEGIKGGHNA